MINDTNQNQRGGSAESRNDGRITSFESVGIYPDYSITSNDQYHTCPKCSKARKKRKAKCLSINVGKGVWNCHHCGWSGAIGNGEVIQGKFDHWRKDRHLPAIKHEIKESEIMDKWFKKRGISSETYKKMGITFGEIYFPQSEGKETCIIFPYFFNGELVNNKYRSGKKYFRQDINAKKCLYNIDAIRELKKGEKIIIVEGEMDVLALMECGFNNVVSPPDGAPAPEAKNFVSKFEWLDDCIELFDDKLVVLAGDNDIAGILLKEELIRRLGPDKCMVVDWEEYKDADNALMERGKDYVIDRIKNAQLAPISSVLHSESVFKNLSGFKDSLIPGAFTELMENEYRPRRGEVTVIIGIPGHGKGVFIDNLMTDLAENHGQGVAYFSPETPTERHLLQISSILTGDHITKIAEAIESKSGEYSGLIEFADKHFHWILPGVPGTPGEKEERTLETILSKAKSLIARYGITQLVIDPWNELEHYRPRNITESEYVGIAMRQIKKFAAENKCHIYVVVHPVKMKSASDDRPRKPGAYDAAGSANWVNKADNVLVIFREIGESSDDDGYCVGAEITPDHYGPADSDTQITVEKIKFSENGKAGSVIRLSFNELNSRFMRV